MKIFLTPPVFNTHSTDKGIVRFNVPLDKL